MKTSWGWVMFAVSLAALLGGIVVWWRSGRTGETTPVIPAQEHRRIASNVLHSVSAATVAEVLRIEAEEKLAEEKFWGKEMLAQECGAVVERFWDAINAATSAAQRWDVIAEFPVGEVVLGGWERFAALPFGIEVAIGGAKPGEAQRRLSTGEWREFLKAAQQAGWEVEGVEFRQNRFAADEQGRPAQSRFYFSAHLKNGLQRAQIEGDVVLAWRGEGEQGRTVQRVDAWGLTLKRRTGELPFRLVLDEEIIPEGQNRIVDPLIVYDLDRDGLSEIVLAGRNLVYRNRGEFRFEREALCKFPEDFLSTALVADFDGDGVADFLAHKWEGTFLFKGSTAGRFDEKPRRVWKPARPLEKPMVMTCGDIDADGDLDIFIGQYKEPYEGGATPKPFYDANDGFPAYLLLNEGNGEFRDATEAAGFAAKRNRRTYSASFADLDGDTDLDLVVVSDFAGADFYRNDGKGRFSDVRREWVQSIGATKAFGMAHALSDFKNDGMIDLLMTGMTSPTVERLDYLGLARNETEIELQMRREMTHGNRLYSGIAAGRFEESSFGESIARSGWSWGCSAFDFDNDGWVDVYVANGLESNASVKDYEGEYWLHDRFVGQTNAGSASDLYFKSKFGRTRSRIDSYGGYEKNRLFLNFQGREFFEAGYLLGVALPQDCRNVVSDDFDGDGRVDLAIVTLEIHPKAKQSLKVFRNGGGPGDAPQNWIGFRFNDGDDWVGAEIRLFAGGKETVRQLVTGDSFRSQHPAAARFGLGSLGRIDRVEIRRVGGAGETIDSPAINQYHRFGPERTRK